jgi:hypothetical protein
MTLPSFYIYIHTATVSRWAGNGMHVWQMEKRRMEEAENLQFEFQLVKLSIRHDGVARRIGHGSLQKLLLVGAWHSFLI